MNALIMTAILEIYIGNLYWKKERPVSHFLNSSTCKKWHTCNAGKLVGRLIRENETLSYKAVKLKGKSYYVHVIIWIMNYGYRPILIDHIDGDGTNNKLGNLREATFTINSRKSKINSRNKSGIKGVRETPNRKWSSAIRYKEKYLHLGIFENKEYAAKIYATAVMIISGENFTPYEEFGIGTDEYNMVYTKIKNRD